MKLIVLIGIPGSGKSTYAKQLCSSNENYIRLNRDDLRSMYNLDSSFSPQNEKLVVKAQLLLLENAFKNNYNVVLDNTNFNPEIFKKIDILAIKYNVEISYKYMDVPLEECLLRNSKRERVVPEDVIKKMYNTYIKGNTEEQIIQKMRSKCVSNYPVMEPIHYRKYRKNEFRNAVIVDIDGTIAEASNRNIFDTSKVLTDEPRQQIIKIINGYVEHYDDINIIVVSGRKSDCFGDTITWLDKHFPRYQVLYMRSEKDMRPDFIVKKQIYDTYIKDHYNVLAVFDDRNQVVDMWRHEGLNVLQVADGDF